MIETEKDIFQRRQVNSFCSFVVNRLNKSFLRIRCSSEKITLSSAMESFLCTKLKKYCKILGTGYHNACFIEIEETINITIVQEFG